MFENKRFKVSLEKSIVIMSKGTMKVGCLYVKLIHVKSVLSM